jgi:hypothetical protein
MGGTSHCSKIYVKPRKKNENENNEKFRVYRPFFLKSVFVPGKKIF